MVARPGTGDLIVPEPAGPVGRARARARTRREARRSDGAWGGSQSAHGTRLVRRRRPARSSVARHITGESRSRSGRRRRSGSVVVFHGAKTPLQGLEQVQPAPGLVFISQPGDAAIEDGDRPSPLEEPFGRRIVRRFARVALLTVLKVE